MGAAGRCRCTGVAPATARPTTSASAEPPCVRPGQPATQRPAPAGSWGAQPERRERRVRRVVRPGSGVHGRLMFEPRTLGGGMAETPLRTVRVPAPLESAARRAAPELAALDFATLARVGLAVLAGMAVPE